MSHHSQNIIHQSKAIQRGRRNMIVENCQKTLLALFINDAICIPGDIFPTQIDIFICGYTPRTFHSAPPWMTFSAKNNQ